MVSKTSESRAYWLTCWNSPESGKCLKERIYFVFFPVTANTDKGGGMGCWCWCVCRGGGEGGRRRGGRGNK